MSDVSENVTNWTASQRKYMVWLATPTDARMPLKHSSLAAELKVDERTLYRWREKPGFYAEVNKLVDEHFMDDYAEIVDSFKRAAKGGSYQHQKTYFEMAGKYKPPTQAHEISGPEGRPIGIEVTAVDYRAAIAPLAPGPVDDSDTPGQD